MKKIIIFILLINISVFASEGLYLIKAMQLTRNPATASEGAKKLLSIAMEGNTVAMTALGRLYLYGKGVPQSCPKAFYLFLNSLTSTELHKKNPEAMKEIADMFKNGICVKKNNKKYLKYYERYLILKGEAQHN